jgi:hypothetical protein
MLDSGVVEILQIKGKDNIMGKITITRTGNRPLSFEGKLIADSDSQNMRGGSSRWHELALYELANGKYVVHVKFRTQWQGELPRDDAEIRDTIERIADYLRGEYDPSMACVRLGREGSGYDSIREKEARRMAELQERYDMAVSALLAELPEEI